MDKKEIPQAAERPLAFSEFQSDADVIENRPLHGGVRWTLYALAGLLASALIWATVSDIDMVVVAHGKLVTPLSNIVVQPLETSIIQRIDVRVGEVVKRGQVLGTLDPTFVEADSAQLREKSRSLKAQMTRLESEMAGKSYSKKGHDGDARLQSEIFAEKKGNYQERLKQQEETIAKLKAALETNHHDQDVLDTRVKALADIEAMQEKLLNEKFGSRLKYLESRERRLEIERDLKMARNREFELHKELAAAEAEKNAFTKEWRQKGMEELVTTKRDYDGVAEQLNKADKRGRLVTLVSPADAVVLEIAKRSVGSVVREAEPLFTLVPLNATLEAEVQIDAADVGYVKLADPARIKFDAFPFQKHGTLSGAVATISEDAFAREPAARANALSESYFLSRVSLGDEKLKSLDKHYRLLPGMTATAEIVVGKRSVISYFLYPLIRSLNESIREP